MILHNCYGGRGCAGPERFGALAQSGERLSGRQKVKGSIPLGSTKIWPGRLVARTLPFQGREAGSEPVRATILNLYLFHLAAILLAKLCTVRIPAISPIAVLKDGKSIVMLSYDIYLLNAALTSSFIW